MKTLIISDTHLGKQFDKRKYCYLDALFQSVDEIIFNGDFWDDSKCTFDEFIESEWKHLFPTMKSKTIYIHGNHDLKTKSDERVQLFCKRVVKSHTMVLLDKTKVIIVHGHEQSKASRFVYFFFSNHPKLLFYILYPIDLLQRYQMYLSKKGYTFVNIINKGYYDQSREKGSILITGHTHAPEINIDMHYSNSGFVDHNFASYILIEGNDIKLMKEFY